MNLLLSCYKLSFADDFKLYLTIKTEADADFLQDQLNVFSDWCTSNRMILNSSKCSVITFTRKQNPIIRDYILHGTVLNRESVVKDLGVLLDSKLSFKDHISYVTTKASAQLGFIFRITKQFKDVYCLKTLYCSLVRSILEYGSVVWSPFYKNGVDRIESVQRKFLRFALRLLPWNDPLNLPNYEDRCKLINLDLLEVRRNVSKATFIADLLTSRINCANLLCQLNINIRSRILRTNDFLRVPGSRTNYCYNSPLASMCRVFNKCYNVFDFNLSRSTIKKRIKQLLCYS